jgi:hypothetical protein
MPVMNVSRVGALFPNLQLLNLSRSSVQRILDDGFTQLPRLRVVDLRGCLVEEFPVRMFQDLDFLESVYAETFKLCCPVLLPPHFNPRQCEAPANELSS